jgi:hypothetical protein
MGMRAASTTARLVDRILGTLRRRGTTAARDIDAAAATAALQAFARWLVASGIPPATQARLRDGARAGLRWRPSTDPAAVDGCVPPGIAASLALGVLVERGLAIETGDGRLRPARLAWAEPPELAVVTTPRLAWLVLRRVLRRGRSG